VTFRVRTMMQGDLLPEFVVDVSDCGDLFDFDGWTLTFSIRGPVIRTGPATGDDQGVLTYQWVAGDTDVPGEYEAVFVGVSPGGRQQTFLVEGMLRIDPV